jgi:hypothetical protein
VLDHRSALAGTLAVFVIASIAFRKAHHAAGAWVIDDAGITYAAAFELADHHSLAPYVGGTPVEGYSNPLLFFVVAGLRGIGAFDPVRTHVRLEMLVFATMVTLTWSTVRRLAGELAALAGAGAFAVLELVTPATWVWFCSGLESVWVSCGLVALIWLTVRTTTGAPLTPRWGALPFLVAITRPESPAYVAAFYAALFGFARPPVLDLRRHLRQVAGALLVTIGLYAVFLCWRRIGYCDWLPNTYYAKLRDHDLAGHLRGYVIPQVLPYCGALLLGGSVLALLVTPAFERLGQCLVVALIASLALPITAGADWMGEHRFATSFLTVCHMCFAVYVASCAVGLARVTPRRWRAAQLMPASGIVLAAAIVGYSGNAVHDDVALNGVTLPYVADLQGGQRWEHQMRLGVPYAVVQMPDAGGSLLVGGMQLLDNGYLTDFQMARLGRAFAPTDGAPGPTTDLGVLHQYQVIERRPDLMDSNAYYPLDSRVLDKDYLTGQGRLLARRGLVEVANVDPRAEQVFDDGHVRVYLSPETVRTAAPGGLVRCELIVAWDGGPIDDKLRIRGMVDGGDHDEISLAPYSKDDHGIERRALLLGSPYWRGAFATSLELVGDGQLVATRRPAFTLEVTTDDAALTRAASALARAGSPLEIARRIAWLGAQSIPRLGMTAFRRQMASMQADNTHRSPRAGGRVLELRWNARRPEPARLPAAIRDAERAAARALFAACPPASDGDFAARATRIACLGRANDELRRLGELDALAAVPEIARELADAHDDYTRGTPAQQYQMLVGLTLADPSDVTLQRSLLAARLALGTSGEFPPLP